MEESQQCSEIMKDCKSRGRRNSKDKKDSEEVQETPQTENTGSNQVLNSLSVENMGQEGGRGTSQQRLSGGQRALRCIRAKPYGNGAGDIGNGAGDIESGAGDMDKPTTWHFHSHSANSSLSRQLLSPSSAPHPQVLLLPPPSRLL